MRKISNNEKTTTGSGIIISTVIAITGVVFSLVSIGLAAANGARKIQQAQKFKPLALTNSSYGFNYYTKNN